MNNIKHLVDNIVELMMSLSAKKQGTLIVFERSDSLDVYIDTSPYETELSRQSFEILLGASVVEGAIIIRGAKIVAAGVVLPLTQNFQYKELGRCHRAAVGISEDMDALALLVSSETGDIKIADGGILRDSPQLGDYI